MVFKDKARQARDIASKRGKPKPVEQEGPAELRHGDVLIFNPWGAPEAPTPERAARIEGARALQELSDRQRGG